MTGCIDFLAGGDLDFDGTPYRSDWPTGPTATASRPSSFLQDEPTSNGSTYAQIQFETDAPASEAACSPAALQNCTVVGPNFPGDFYPFFSQGLVSGSCEWEFGQVTSAANSFGGANQYGTPTARFFGTDASGIIDNPTCGG